MVEDDEGTITGRRLFKLPAQFATDQSRLVFRVHGPVTEHCPGSGSDAAVSGSTGSPEQPQSPVDPVTSFQPPNLRSGYLGDIVSVQPGRWPPSFRLYTAAGG